MEQAVQPQTDNGPIKVLSDHRINTFNRECVDVVTVGPPSSDGAFHGYRILVRKTDADGNPSQVHSVDLMFQDGGLKEAGPNGISDQALLAIVLDRWRAFNEGPYRCRENAIAITKLEEALLWNQKRADDRAKRGVEGERLA